MLSIIIVNYKSEEYIEACVQSIQENFYNDAFEVVIVNSDQSKFRFKGFEKLVKFLDLEENRGYGYSINRGVEIAKGNYVLLLNPDTLIQSGLNNAYNYVKNHNSIIGANLYTESGLQQQYAFGKFHSGIRVLLNKVGNSNCVLKKDLTKCDWVSGTAMIMRKSLFNKLNGFDENFFMYFEDQDICFRAKSIGVDTYVMRNFKVIHYGGRSFRSNKKKLREYNKSLIYFIKKNGNLFDRLFIQLLKPIYDTFKH